MCSRRLRRASRTSWAWSSARRLKLSSQPARHRICRRTMRTFAAQSTGATRQRSGGDWRRPTKRSRSIRTSRRPGRACPFSMRCSMSTRRRRPPTRMRHTTRPSEPSHSLRTVPMDTSRARSMSSRSRSIRPLPEPRARLPSGLPRRRPTRCVDWQIPKQPSGSGRLRSRMRGRRQRSTRAPRMAWISSLGRSCGSAATRRVVPRPSARSRWNQPTSRCTCIA